MCACLTFEPHSSLELAGFVAELTRHPATALFRDRVNPRQRRHDRGVPEAEKMSLPCLARGPGGSKP